MTAYFSMWGMNASATEAFKVAPYTMVAALKVQILNNWKCKFNTFLTIKSLVGICHFNLELFLLKSAFHLSLQRKTVQGWWRNTSVRVSPVFENIRKISAFESVWPLIDSGIWKSLVKVELTLKPLGDDPFVLDLEWNKPTTTTHPLGIDIEVVWYFKIILTKLDISKESWQS